MSSLEPFGKLLILVGVFIIILGLTLVLWGRVPFLGKLSGDIFLQKGNFRFIFPVATCLVISAVLTIVVNLVIRFLGK
jgi:hypothetical protein